ncbi:transcriptional regulator, y4mF family [Mycobacteroides abscessus subsp. abscessus]|uniref:helix-turn-helix domain-containing protein n=1 Tax=Mycobacteroides abscessus TaxID=36809 RepID=UPI000927E98F|nr:helix-turn-helix transcriptional regulator [Mycobacteroides abscessus]SHX96805.1 transcriptional regulator, y4mF family [Mycobacteroides abscessus subsp. abscessus]SIC77866.1 transcriptional regulator, y4mF family [Mycobacteroides abscessus subsp. abscessus]SKP27745.1 transcriptional regulator, y4mF family [Mycobacteroides abscessus subsp. abscessus]
MSTAAAIVSTTHRRTFGRLVRTRRDALGLTRKQLAHAGGPTAATIDAVEQGLPSHLTADTLSQLDVALQWPSTTAYRLYTDAHAVAQHIRNTAADPDELLGMYRTLERLDAPARILAEIAEHLDTELRPRLQGVLAGLQAPDLITMYQVAHRVLASPARRPQTQQAHAAVARLGRPRGRQQQPIPHVPVAQGRSISLREFRIVHTGWTLDEAAAQLTAERRRANAAARPVTRGAVSAIETGLRGMSTEMAHALERVYQLVPQTLAGQIRVRRTAITGSS